MCCSMTPGVVVRFSDTVLYGAQTTVRGSSVHALGYQNKMQDHVGERRWSLKSLLPIGPGNAMILPFPALPGSMTVANVVDTHKCRDILQDMADAVRPLESRFMMMPAVARGGSAPRVQVFDAAGIYTVVLAQDARDIPGALKRVPASRRPAMNPALFDAYSEWYPGWTIALCCFNNRKARLADPLLWWYQPMNPDELFLPALDCHTGDVPDLGAKVNVDHAVVVAADGMTGGEKVYYRSFYELPDSIRPYLPSQVIGTYFSGPMANGDFVCSVADVRRGDFKPIRTAPVAAAA